MYGSPFCQKIKIDLIFFSSISLFSQNFKIKSGTAEIKV